MLQERIAISDIQAVLENELSFKKWLSKIV
jgi:hypothetical protein